MLNNGFIVRPLSNSGRAKSNDTFRVYLSSKAIASLNGHAGDIFEAGRTAGVESRSSQVEIWPAQEKIQDSIIQTSRSLQNHLRLSLGDHVSLVKSDQLMGDCVKLGICETHDSEDKAIPLDEVAHWEYILEQIIGNWCERKYLILLLTYCRKSRKDRHPWLGHAF